MVAEVATIPVTVDKSHIVTIGERLYSRSVELIRELVNNAYDADATEVKIMVAEGTITVEDNGVGMDLAGLEQYFNIGSPQKKLDSKSPRFGRDRIGEFGIGKFASLSACQHFEVETQKSGFAARVVFDKAEWANGNHWRLPIFILDALPWKHDGTKVVLRKLTRSFNLADVEKRIIESVPIKAPHFAVYLNGKKITARYVPGKHLPFFEPADDYGLVHGEIVIVTTKKPQLEECGIAIKVKQATITRSLFGMETWRDAAQRVTGEVHADFLPITSDRTGFVVDSPEYEAFMRVIERVKECVRHELASLSDRRDNRRVQRTLREVMDKIEKALLRNPEFSPFGMFPKGEEINETGPGGKYGALPQQEKKTGIDEKKRCKESKKRKERQEKVHLHRLSPTAVVRQAKVGNKGVTCLIDHYGPEAPETYTEGTVIHINRDHPLYQREARKKDSYAMYVARLITQEISLMRNPEDPREAYERQSRLLRDAFIEPV